MDVAVLIPVKGFTDAKRRLAPALSADERRALARTMAERVIAACGDLPVAVVCDDPEVVEWAAGHDVTVVTAPGRGLNRAVEFGVDHLAGLGAAQVIVAHADLPMANDMTQLSRFGGVTLVPDRRDDGTNVACIPTGRGFRFAYGPGSFGLHCREARRCELGLHIVRRADLAWDVDQPDDLLLPSHA
jgi:2-phospho-L-lactate/phosphoenolpyruvate guanylyltransferase